jgi:hypothetical protein
MKTLRKKLKDMKGAWVEFLPEVLCSYQTTIQSPIKETPFSLAFRSEAIILVEVGSVNFRVKHYNPRLNEEGTKVSLDLLQEKRDEAQVTMAAYQQRTTKYFNKRV